MMLSRPSLVSSNAAGSRWKVSLRSGSFTGSKLRQRRMLIAAVGQRGASAQEQDAAAAPVGEFADQVLLRRR